MQNIEGFKDAALAVGISSRTVDLFLWSIKFPGIKFDLESFATPSKQRLILIFLQELEKLMADLGYTKEILLDYFRLTRKEFVAKHPVHAYGSINYNGGKKGIFGLISEVVVFRMLAGVELQNIIDTPREVLNILMLADTYGAGQVLEKLTELQVGSNSFDAAKELYFEARKYFQYGPNWQMYFNEFQRQTSAQGMWELTAKMLFDYLQNRPEYLKRKYEALVGDLMLQTPKFSFREQVGILQEAYEELPAWSDFLTKIALHEYRITSEKMPVIPQYSDLGQVFENLFDELRMISREDVRRLIEIITDVEMSQIKTNMDNFNTLCFKVKTMLEIELLRRSTSAHES
jgi:hypothetical protein